MRAKTDWWPRGAASPPLPCRPSSSSGVDRLPGWRWQPPRYRTACPRLRLYRSTLLLWLKCCPSSVAPTQLSLFLSPTGCTSSTRVSPLQTVLFSLFGLTFRNQLPFVLCATTTTWRRQSGEELRLRGSRGRTPGSHTSTRVIRETSSPLRYQVGISLPPSPRV